MITERDLTEKMRAELKRNGIVASYKDYEVRKAHLIDINSRLNSPLDFIPDFIMIDLLKEYEYSFSYKNMDEFADGVLGYKHGTVQLMRKIARHFFVFDSDLKEFVLDKDFKDYSSTQLERMAKWSKQELLNANINPTMKVNEIDAKVRENGLNKQTRVTDEEYRIISAYRIADDEIKNEIRSLLNMHILSVKMDNQTF